LLNSFSENDFPHGNKYGKNVILYSNGSILRNKTIASGLNEFLQVISLFLEICMTE